MESRGRVEQLRKQHRKRAEMVHLRSMRKVGDNSGVDKVRCIGVLNGKSDGWGYTGDLVTVSVQRRGRKAGKITGVAPQPAGTVRTGVLLGTKGGKETGLGYAQLDDNYVALMSKGGSVLGSRVKVPVSVALRKKGFLKVRSLSRGGKTL